ncbi:alpha/beta hydrolase [Amycolatopsis sp.]|uniref:alpha/beta hydrolase n=1 Tax=Amycolatopsis sp. TaxID=37632 RepID=UPI002B524113|nr:alpha/beta hydrolase [Amycolatopsis sp.]HVV11953.1 alpha/beta hydrolase [Amycolatopsis sp.]
MPDNDRMLLLGFHPEDLRVILARNNPDDARHVVVIIPGIGRSLDEHTGQAEDLYRKVAAGPDDDSVSVITWADYVAPESAREARDPAFAVPAAPRLASFLAGLRVTAKQFGRHKKAARIVVVARGYGGLVAGLTGRDHGLDADALVFLGCAAAGVETASELRIGGPVYATPSDAGDGTPLGIHGPRPDSPAFGAQPLRPGPLSFRSDPFVRYLPSLRRIILDKA